MPYSESGKADADIASKEIEGKKDQLLDGLTGLIERCEKRPVVPEAVAYDKANGKEHGEQHPQASFPPRRVKDGMQELGAFGFQTSSPVW